MPCRQHTGQCIGYRQLAPDPHGSCTGSRYDWLTCGTPLGCRRRGRSCSPVGVKNKKGVDVQAISYLAISFPLFWNYKLTLRVGLGLGLGRVMGRLGLGWGVGLDASLLLIADCRYTIRGYRVPVPDTRPTIIYTNINIKTIKHKH